MSRVVTNEAITALKAAGFTVGDASGEGLAAPYVVVHPLETGREGTLGDPHALDGAGTVLDGVQVTCVGQSREQVEWLAEEVTAMLTGHDGGWWVSVDEQGPVVRDDTGAGPPLFETYPRFTIHTGAA